MESLENLQWLQSESVQKIFSILEESGAETRVVGGAVRNSILGLEFKEIDFATTATPDEVIALFTAKKIRTIPTGAEYGTVTVVLDSVNYEVTTLREDIQTDGRHAVVKFGKNWSKDAERRDFTMNALYLDRYGKLFDYTGGYQDCLNKKIEFIGSAEQRIQEDYLRILRYFRFMATFGFVEFDKATMSAILKNKNGLNQLSPERISMEMKKILVGSFAAEIIEKMVETGLFQILTGGDVHLPQFQKLIQLSKSLKFEINPTVMIYTLVISDSEDIDRVVEKMHFLNSERKRMHSIYEFSKVSILDLADLELTKLLYKYGRQTSFDGVLIQFINGQLPEQKSKLNLILRKLSELEIPEFEISGKDLITMGVKPGKQMGELLKRGESAWINSGFKLSKNELLQLIGNLTEVDT